MYDLLFAPGIKEKHLWKKVFYVKMQIDKFHRHLQYLFFVHFASKKQLPGFFTSGTLAWNRLRTKKVLICYKNIIFFWTTLFYILSWVDIFLLKSGKQYLANAGVVVSVIACHRYCPSSNLARAKFRPCNFCPSTVTLPNSYDCLYGVQVVWNGQSAKSVKTVFEWM